jgi:short-subunit dehydrogenase
MELEGRTILITGANRGIGRAIAERLATEPVRLLVGVRDLGSYEPIVAPSDGATEIRPVRMDLGSRESIDECLDSLGPEVDQIDVLINNAGEFTAGQIEQQDLGLVYAMVQANLLGPIHLTHRILPGMLKRGAGKIVNQGSIVGYMFFPGVSTYSATKAGVIGFTECLARELHDTDVSVLELITGGVDTDMLAVARDELSEHMDTSSFIQYSPEEWAEKVVGAIRSDDAVVGPGGKAALGKLATRGPRWLLNTVASRTFERT